jgi:tetratricopeptide (TPR) repeat protein
MASAVTRRLAPLAALLLAGFSPLEAEEPRVREGNEQLSAGQAAAALERYDAAEREAGAHPEIDYDRGNALDALGRRGEAKAAWDRAAERDARGPLASRALQNLGNALAAQGDRDGAVKAYSDALARDPSNEDARYNLEVLLRKRSQGKGAPRDPGDQGRRPEQGPGQPGAGAQPPQAASRPGAQARDQAPPKDEQGRTPEPRPGQAKDEGRRDGERGAKAEGKGGPERAAGQAGTRGPGDEGRDGTARADGLARQDAERLLDALRARERNMPLGPAGRRDARRRDVEKDW